MYRSYKRFKTVPLFWPNLYDVLVAGVSNDATTAQILHLKMSN